MLSSSDVAKVYDTILSIPGMNETVKIDIRVLRRNVLLLNRVIKRGLNVKDDAGSSHLLGSIPPEILSELSALGDDFLAKAGLTELNEKLNALGLEK